MKMFKDRLKNNTKSIKLILVMLGTTLCLTGCKGSTNLSTWVTSTLMEKITEREQQNREILNELHNANIITDSEYSAMVTNMETNLASYTITTTEGSSSNSVQLDESEAKKVVKSIADAVSRMHLAKEHAPESISLSVEDNDGNTTHAALTHHTYYKNGDATLYWHWCNGTGDGTEHTEGDTIVNISGTGRKGEDSGDIDQVALYVASNYLLWNHFDGDWGTTVENFGYDSEDRSTFKAGDVVYRVTKEGASEKDIAEKGTKWNKGIKPLVIIDKTDILDDLTETPIYVLLSSKVTSGSLDEVISCVDTYTNKASSDKSTMSGLASYFGPITDKNGDYIHLLDENYLGNEKLVQVTKPNITQSDGHVKTSAENELGYDLMIDQDELSRVIDVRLKEFNYKVYQKILDIAGLDTTKYYLCAEGNGVRRAYLMEYPVSVINSLTLIESSNIVRVGFVKSALGVNLMSQKFVNYEVENTNGVLSTNYYTSYHEDYGTEAYLTLTPAQNNDAESLCSLVVSGESTVNIRSVSGENGHEYTVKCARIILRDYLELTFAPGYETGDDTQAVVFGRKIRFDMTPDKFETQADGNTTLAYTRGENVAYFVDTNGARINQSPELTINDFCDASGFLQKNVADCSVIRLAYQNEDAGTVSRSPESKAPSIDEITVTIRGNASSIEPVVMFPSPDLGAADFGLTDQKLNRQRFYAIATTKGIFDSALFSSWIESTVQDACLDWWNLYLADAGFTYTIDKAKLVDFLQSNYAYELGGEGVVILDLETVAKIEEIYSREDNASKVSFIRTIFMIVGWFLIGYSFVLLLFWVADTNTDLGFGLLEKGTFGHWVAVKYAEDVPRQSQNDKKYMSFGPMLIKVLIMIALGITLIVVDIFSIVYTLIDHFGRIAVWIEEVIRGLR